MRLKAEWERQLALILVWPHDRNIWGCDHASIQQFYRLWIAQLLEEQDVILIIPPDSPAPIAKSHPRLQQIAIANNDIWIRDYGPIAFEQNGQTHYLNTQFNGWGHKYPATLDNRVNTVLAKILDLNLHDCSWVLEGGNIETNGQQHVLLSQACQLKRQPTLTPAELSRKITQLLPGHTINCITQGFIEGDDTDGHIDTLVRFCNAQTLAYSSCDDPDDLHHQRLQNLALELAKDYPMQQKIALPLPAPIFSRRQRLPATYVNFLITNHSVWVPAYQDPHDGIAKERLQACFPNHQVRSIDCRSLILQGGSLHCMSIPLFR